MQTRLDRDALPPDLKDISIALAPDDIAPADLADLWIDLGGGG